MKAMELSVLTAAGFGAVLWLFMAITPAAEGLARDLLSPKGCGGKGALCLHTP